MKKCKKYGEVINFQNEDFCNACFKEIWIQAQQQGMKDYEEEYGEGSWEEADKYAREDYVWGAYTKIKDQY